MGGEGKKSRVQQRRGPKPSEKRARGARAGGGKGIPFDGFSLERSERHLENFHRSTPGSTADDDYFRITRALVVAARQWRKLANDRIRPLKQTMARWETLYLVAFSDEELTQSELAQRIGVEGPTMVRMLHILAAEGLLERHQSPRDLRVTINRITEKGRAEIVEIMNITNALRAEILQDIDPGELAATHKVLTSILRNLGRSRGQQTQDSR